MIILYCKRKDGNTVRFETPEHTALPDLLEVMMDFLKGIGYPLDRLDSLEIVAENEITVDKEHYLALGELAER